MTNLEYCTEILSIIGNVTTPTEAIYNLAFNAYQMLGGQETQPTLETIYNELQAAITLYNNTSDLNINTNGVYSLLNKNVNVNIPAGTDDRLILDFSNNNGITIKFGLTTKYLDPQKTPSDYFTTEFSYDNLVWTPIVPNTEGDYHSIDTSEHTTIFIRGKILKNCVFGSGTDCFRNFHFSTDLDVNINVKVKGNIMYLYDYENTGSKTLTYSNCFAGLFYRLGTKVHLNIQELSLPATTLSSQCYQYMFAGQGQADQSDYYYIDGGIPKHFLPAISLSSSCYNGMFRGVRGISTMPYLPAIELASACYRAMFAESSIIISSTGTNSCILPATTLANSCYYYMFADCHSVYASPVLPARKLKTSCYSQMFWDCQQLSSITCYANDLSALQATYNWTSNVAASGTFTKDSNTTWQTGQSGIPDNWTIVND